MAYLLLKTPNPVDAGIRAGYALAGFGTSASAISQFPRAGSGDIEVTINGVPATIRRGNASAYSASGLPEYNGYLIRERNSTDFAVFGPGRPTDAKGGLYWISFAAGFKPESGLEFDFVDETCPTPNPKREPRNAKAEEARKAGFIKWAATKDGGKLREPTRPYDSSDPYFAAKVAADWDSALAEVAERAEAEKAEKAAKLAEAKALVAEAAKAEKEAAKAK
jgi:hypothetical protein